MNTQEKNKAQSRRALAEIDRGNFDIMDELSAPGATFDFPGGPKVDITGFKGFCAMFRAAFPDFVHDINDMVAEGEKVVRRLLESPLPVISVLLPPKWVEEYRPLLEGRPEMITAYTTDKDLLEQLVGFSMYQGLLAVGKIPAPESLDEILARSPKPRLLVAVDGLSSAENLGALVRNCAAFNAQALVVGETSCSPFLRRAVRSSMGAIFHLPVAQVSGLAEAVHGLTRCGIRCIAAHPHIEGRTLSQADFTGDCCIVLGSEGHGISPPVLAACEESFAIPMPATVDSLNVGSAAAVFLYEANRQRRRSPFA